MIYIYIYIYSSVLLCWLFKQALCALSAETENWGKKPSFVLEFQTSSWPSLDFQSFTWNRVKTRGWIYFQQFLVPYCHFFLFFFCVYRFYQCFICIKSLNKRDNIFTFIFTHLADTFIQSDLHCIQVTVFFFYQLLLSLGIEPMILALLAPCSTIWATGKLK